MVLEDLDSKVEGARPVTPMAEIRRRQAITLEEFTRTYPDFEWSERRRTLLLFDERGVTWVPTVDAVHGLSYEFDDPELTPEIEDWLWELSERALEEVRAGRVTYLDELEDEDD